MPNSLENPDSSHIHWPSDNDEALRQGEILSGIRQVVLTSFDYEPGRIDAEYHRHDFAIIVSQDCDLSQGFFQVKNLTNEFTRLPHVLFCMVTTAEAMRGRPKPAHLVSAQWKNVKQNKHERYHFLQGVGPAQDAESEGLPELGVDFKRYFCLQTEAVYAQIASRKALRRCRLTSPYLEHFSTRFCYYQFRVALPEDHLSE